MDKPAELQRRKAELKAQIEVQQAEIKQTIQEIRAELEPAKLLKRAVGGALDLSPSKEGPGAPLFPKLPAPISFALDLLVRDPRWAMGLKLLAPVAIKMLPALLRKSDKPQPKTPEEEPAKEETPSVPLKTRATRQLRNVISSLRKSLRKKDEGPEQHPVEYNPD